mmetsp:Transcript_25065/g.50632  ORF Transcript_25065/g.50632 Transcript_25065/m.50632 type:complete len:419 (+) Transcript_25065:162-1418(+)
MASGGNSNSPFAWLGLLKWSLAYSDGTRPTEDVQPMSKEDIAFLEKVMKEGIIDEGERMKTILKDLTDSLEGMLGLSLGGESSETTSGDNEGETKKKELDEDEMIELLQELKDIVEQIDYARAFMAMGGIPFLLGCATSPPEGTNETAIPKSIRKWALSVLATMCQNNPPVQLSLLEHGHMPPLIQLFFDYSPTNESDGDDSMRDKVVQTISCSVRGHSMAEHIFCQNKHGVLMVHLGLGIQSKSKPSAQLRKRCLFLLRALVTADDAVNSRIKPFQSAISFVATRGVDPKEEADVEIREMGLQMLTQMLRHAPQIMSDRSSQSPNVASSEEFTLGKKIIHDNKNHLTAIGVKRIQDIRKLEKGSDEYELAALELEEWENLMVAMAETSSSAYPPNNNTGRNENEEDTPKLMICDMHP